MRFTVHALRGTTRSNDALCILYAGGGQYLHYLKELAFAEEPKSECLGRRNLATLHHLARLTGAHNPDSEKLSPYECGFEAFEDARMKFDVRYYLVAILFILFDLEIAFLFPWAVVLNEIGFAGFLSMMLFLAILTVGFVYEWMKGALEWE